MGPASSREQIGEQIGDDDGLQIHPKTAIVANNVVSVSRIVLSFASRSIR